MALSDRPHVRPSHRDFVLRNPISAIAFGLDRAVASSNGLRKLAVSRSHASIGGGLITSPDFRRN